MSGDGIWHYSGSGTSGDHDITDFSYSGSGTYAYSGGGVSMSGTIEEGGHNHQGTSSDEQYDYDDAGWHLTSGTSTVDRSSHADWSYSGNGTYSFSGGGLNIHGTVKEGGGQNNADSYNTTSTYSASTGWLTSGSSTTTTGAQASFGYSGSGTYSYSGGGVSVSGSVEEGGGQGTSFTRSTTGTLAAGGDWSYSGSGGGGQGNSSFFGWSGSGTYAYSAGDVSASGTIKEGGSVGASFSESYQEELGAEGWVWTSGTRTHSSQDASEWSYSGSGTYARTVEGGSLGGKVMEGGGEGHNYQNASTEELQSDGTWLSPGSASPDAHARRSSRIRAREATRTV